MARTQSTLSDVKRAAIKRYPDCALRLPEPGEQWLGKDIGIERGAVRVFHEAGVIEPREYETPQTSRRYWETATGVTDWINRHAERSNETPCGQASGIHTIEPGVYTCTCDDCDCRMDRETAEAVFA